MGGLEVEGLGRASERRREEGRGPYAGTCGGTQRRNTPENALSDL